MYKKNYLLQLKQHRNTLQFHLLFSVQLFKYCYTIICLSKSVIFTKVVQIKHTRSTADINDFGHKLSEYVFNLYVEGISRP